MGRRRTSSIRQNQRRKQHGMRFRCFIHLKKKIILYRLTQKLQRRKEEEKEEEEEEEGLCTIQK